MCMDVARRAEGRGEDRPSSSDGVLHPCLRGKGRVSGAWGLTSCQGPSSTNGAQPSKDLPNSCLLCARRQPQNKIQEMSIFVSVGTQKTNFLVSHLFTGISWDFSVVFPCCLSTSCCFPPRRVCLSPFLCVEPLPSLSQLLDSWGTREKKDLSIFNLPWLLLWGRVKDGVSLLQSTLTPSMVSGLLFCLVHHSTSHVVRLLWQVDLAPPGKKSGYLASALVSIVFQWPLHHSPPPPFLTPGPASPEPCSLGPTLLSAGLPEEISAAFLRNPIALCPLL